MANQNATIQDVTLTSGARSWWGRTCVRRGTCYRRHPDRHAGFRHPGHGGYATQRARYPKTRPRSGGQGKARQGAVYRGGEKAVQREEAKYGEVSAGLAGGSADNMSLLLHIVEGSERPGTHAAKEKRKKGSAAKGATGTRMALPVVFPMFGTSIWEYIMARLRCRVNILFSFPSIYVQRLRSPRIMGGGGCSRNRFKFTSSNQERHLYGRNQAHLLCIHSYL